MKIISLQAENFKRLKAVEIQPDGSTVIISGRNAQGKSSVLDAIWAALAGKEGVKETARPIRDGEKKAHVTLEFEDLVVTRKWSGARTELVVSSKAGAKFPTPQKMLDDLIGRLSFDPLAFATMEPKKQVETLIDITGQRDYFDTIAAQRKQAYEERTDVNREVKRLSAQLESLPEVTATPDAEEVSVAELTQRYIEAQKVLARKRDLLNEHRSIADKVREMEQEIARLQERSAEVVAEGRALPKIEPEDLADLENQIDSAEEHNRQAREVRQVAEVNNSLTDSKEKSNDLSARIRQLDEEKAEALATAPLPVEGLSFDEEGVLYNGVPFSQASAAERLRISVAMAMAMNPQVRVIRITDGSLLDSDNLALIDSMAQENDYQVWIERVDESGEVGVVIEDGEVKA